MEWSGTIIPFHCLDILRWNGTNYSFHCLESEPNGMSYKLFILFLSFYQKHCYIKLKHVIIFTKNTCYFERK